MHYSLFKNNRLTKDSVSKNEILYSLSSVQRAIELGDNFTAYGKELEIFTFLLTRIKYTSLEHVISLIEFGYTNSAFYKPMKCGFSENLFNYKCNVLQDIIKLNDPEKTLLYIHDLCGYALEIALDSTVSESLIRKISEYILDEIF